MKRPPRRPRAASARDPLFNSSVQKALAMLESFGGERRERSLAAPAEAQRIVRGSQLRPLPPLTLTDPRQILKRIAAAREAGYEWSDQECYRGDLTIAAAVLGADGQPLAALNISAPTSRWTLAELRSKLAPLLLQTARAASQGDLPRPRRP